MGEMSENMRNTLSTFLYRTGTRSDKIMLVLATNEPALFDRAIIDRVDELIELGLPGLDERAALLEKYYAEAILDPVRRIRVADDAVISKEDGSMLRTQGGLVICRFLVVNMFNQGFKIANQTN